MFLFHILFPAITLIFTFLLYLTNRYYTKQLELIVKFSSDLNSSLEISRILPLVVEKLMLILKPVRCSIMLLDENQELRIRYGKNISNYAVRGLKLKVGEGIAGKALKEGKPIFIKNVAETNDYYKLFPSTYKEVRKESLVVIPLKFQDINFGVINLHYTRRKKFPKDRIEKLVLKLISDQLGNMLHNCLVYQKAVSDSMTNLYNHNYFMSKLTEEMYLARKFSTKLSLILFDIDSFKKINDEYGHQVGDKVIVTVAQILKNNIRLDDIAGRYGGEEFGIILPRSGLEEAKNIAERIRKLIEETKIIINPVGTRMLSVTCSFGVAEFNYNEDIETFVKRADKMLYTAKNLGRNKVYG